MLATQDQELLKLGDYLIRISSVSDFHTLDHRVSGVLSVSVDLLLMNSSEMEEKLTVFNLHYGTLGCTYHRVCKFQVIRSLHSCPNFPGMTPVFISHLLDPSVAIYWLEHLDT